MTAWRAIGIAAFVAASLGSPIHAQTFSADEFRALGVQRLQEGNLADASVIVNALLARDAKDAGALILGAQIATAAGDSAEAARLAKAAYWQTETSNDSFVAARIAANAHAALEQDSLAQLWLRRARQYSPNDQASEGIARDYAFLRSRNPWSSQLRFGITPTSNANGGGSGEINSFGLIFSVDPPLPALEITGNASTSYRIDSTETFATFVDFFANIRTYHLLPKANTLKPDAVGSDFASGSIGIGLRHRQIFSDGALPTDLSLRFAQNWASGEVDTRTLDFGIGQRWAVSDDASFSINLSNQYLIEKEEPDATNVGLTAGWSQSLGQDSFRISLSGLDSYSDNRSRDYTNVRATGSYDFGESINGLNFGFDFEHGLREYKRQFTFFPGIDRKDRTTSVTVRVRNENIEFYGFQPVASLTGTRVDSSIDQFDAEFLSLGFDLQSSF